MKSCDKKSIVGDENYNKNFFQLLYELEDKNFWFRSRNRIIKNLIQKYYQKDKQTIFFEIGCGTGYVLKGLEKIDNIKLIGADIHKEGLEYARERLPDVEFIQLDVNAMNFHNQFEYIGAFDILEHIDDDLRAIKNIHSALKKGGLFFLSVPQHKFIYNYLDEIAHHKRRYSRKDLLRKLEVSGFAIKYYTSFVFLLFPVMLFSRVIKSLKFNKDFKVDEVIKELKINKSLNKMFEIFSRIDELLIRIGFKLPFGGSLIVVAEKL